MCAEQIATLFGARYVDGGIIGLPAVVPGTTRLYLSGGQAEQVASLFTAGPMAAQVLSESANPCAASALKMSYAAFTKGSSALLLGVCALAEAYGVGQSLQQEWSISQPALVDRAKLTAAAVAPKSWRFEGEMQEIANTFSAVNLPPGFHQAAAELYRALGCFKDQAAAATLPEVVEALLEKKHSR
jgi:3-hydroxyisobutyrate dehydrogenase-like beta-hydroxyacid dehydrogenase